MDWDKLKAFYHVANVGSITEASEYMNLSQSSVSRQVLSLEDRLRCPLFHRHSRGISLTKQGQILFDAVKKIFSEIESAKTLIQEEKEDPRGNLKVATTYSLASLWLTGMVPEFLEKYPDIRLTIIGNDDELDLSTHRADVAIRPMIPHQPDLVQHYLLSFHLKLYASVDYLQKHGTPQSPEDLDHHQLLTFGEDIIHPYGNINWLLRVGAKAGQVRESYIKMNSSMGLRRLAEEGMGIAALSAEYAAQKTPKGSKLVEVLPDLKGPVVDLYYIYPEQLKGSKRVLALYDFINEELPKTYPEQFTSRSK
ncbi:MAG: LysR family transcriptional regulator [Alphaproteobacteria bacterium]